MEVRVFAERGPHLYIGLESDIVREASREEEEQAVARARVESVRCVRARGRKTRGVFAHKITKCNNRTYGVGAKSARERGGQLTAAESEK